MRRRNKEVLVSLAAAAMTAAPAALAQPTTSPASSAPAATAADVVAGVQKACLPILRGGKVKPAAQSAGFKLRDGGWVMPVAGKDEVDLAPPDAVNPHVCTLSISAPPTEGAAMRSALGAWAAAQSPPLAPAGVNQAAPGAPGWVTSTWSGRTTGGRESVVLTQPQTAAPSSAPATDQPAAAEQQSTLLVSLSPA